jgi:hypothetical protein
MAFCLRLDDVGLPFGGDDMKLTPQEKLDVALRCYNALTQAAALGAKLSIHPQSLSFWLSGRQTTLDMARDAKSEIDAQV